MTMYYGSDGKRYTISGTSFAHGGEGDIFKVDQHPDLLAKILHDNTRSMGRYLKIKFWESISNTLSADFLSQVAAPQTALFTSPACKSEDFCGFTMRRVEDFESFDKVLEENNLSLDQRVQLSMNLATLVASLHRVGVVLGDYNPQNFACHSCGLLTLVDIDSCQVTVEIKGMSKLLPCVASQPDIRAPELDRRLAQAEKTHTVSQSADNPLYNIDTDLYGLAYMIFTLLMSGCSPYAARTDTSKMVYRHRQSTSASSFNGRAQKGIFVFAKPYDNLLPPRYAPDFKILSPALRRLFKRAFIDGASDPSARPTPEEFYEALEKYRFQIKPRRKCGHYMPVHYLHKCEFCRIQEERESHTKVS